MRIAILESDAAALDCALEILSSAGHLCFGALCDKTLHGLLSQVPVDLVILDWVAPDALRYDTLRCLCRHGSVIPVVLCVKSCTSQKVIAAGLKSGANICLEKPLGSAQSLARIHAYGAS
ncbi:response regulator transcription factor [Paraburkholderia aspalathi]|uniref:Response regulator receiver domain-containing protein n=1 Tax=Paraburkholderia aspalathi TaxID=1324617 RepID=A0A1I7ELS4_9BURK|nr:response regulator transcription factor [Paraburkholderia aspalathi]SFU24845.1 Response regulator receiver domain-containing protein [Paraburkholderia aspalathi]